MDDSNTNGADSGTNKTKSEVVGEIFDLWEGLVSEIISYHSHTLKLEHLKLPSFFIMNYLHRNGPQNLSSLASVTGVSKPTITSIVDKLESHGFVTRQVDEEDRRRFAVVLTPKALDKIERINFSRDDIKRQLAESLDIDQLETFHHSLDVLGSIVLTASQKRLKTIEEGDENI